MSSIVILMALRHQSNLCVAQSPCPADVTVVGHLYTRTRFMASTMLYRQNARMALLTIAREAVSVRANSSCDLPFTSTRWACAACCATTPLLSVACCACAETARTLQRMVCDDRAFRKFHDDLKKKQFTANGTHCIESSYNDGQFATK